MDAGDIQEHLPRTFDYEVLIELDQLLLNCETPLATDFMISLSCPSLGIPEDAPLSCIAQKYSSIIKDGEEWWCALIYDGGSWTIYGQLTEALIPDPIQMEIRRFTEDLGQPPFAVAKITLGQLFSNAIPSTLSMAGDADVYRLQDNLWIGGLRFTLKFKTEDSQQQSGSELGATQLMGRLRQNHRL